MMYVSACFLPLLASIYSSSLADAQTHFYNCSWPIDYRRTWDFHCFNREDCLSSPFSSSSSTSSVVICQKDLDPICPDGSDQDKHLCQRVWTNKFYCCDGRLTEVNTVCDGICDCLGSCDDEDVCHNKLQCDWAVVRGGMSNGIIVAITLSVSFILMLVVLIVVCLKRKGQNSEPDAGSEQNASVPLQTLDKEAMVEEA